MGFGYVFLGCLFFCNLTYRNFTDVFAIALILFGLSTLAPYAKGFKNAFRIGIPTLAFAFFSFVLEILLLLDFFPVPVALLSALAIVNILCKASFLWLFFFGVEEIADETDLPKLKAHALRSRFLTPVYAMMGLILDMKVFQEQTVFLQYFLICYLLFGLIYVILNAKTVYECYILICYEGDENMESSKPSFLERRKKKQEAEDEEDGNI